jgi:hypothetical protein
VSKCLNPPLLRTKYPAAKMTASNFLDYSNNELKKQLISNSQQFNLLLPHVSLFWQTSNFQDRNDDNDWFGIFQFSSILFRSFGLIAPKTLIYLAFDCVRTWWSLFQKRSVRTNYDIYYYSFCFVETPWDPNRCQNGALCQPRSSWLLDI